MTDEIDWRAVTFAGNRRRQREEFRTLPLRDKLIVIEQLSMVAEYFRARRRAARATEDTQVCEQAAVAHHRETPALHGPLDDVSSGSR